MNDIAILDKLYDGLKFKNAEYSEKTNTCVINFLYNPEMFQPNDENKRILNEKISSLVGDFVKYNANYISCPLDKRTIANHTYTTIIHTMMCL